MRRSFLFAAALLMGATVLPAAACSVVPGYRIPTTLQLVEQADLIVLARVEDGRGGTDDDPELKLVPILTLKGVNPPPKLDMAGALETGNMRATPSDPTEIVRANPDAYTGACNRYVFRRGATLLLFFRREGQGYVQISQPFARTAEDVTGIDSLWVRVVREYIAIDEFPPALRRARLAARRDLLRTKADPESRAIAADMDATLNTVRKPLRAPLPPAPAEDRP
ncbi:hypothetical protein [Sphingomonas sp.]|uniref:hypothetical protein n=1 Tax=Sphingomonas sp. TaxID=28214 RepID=UPI001ED0419E|nr:hypothetical protein [Sphingomonas sp.]MBX3594003.1 hypothetical protein [Sphingomonas sp.]